MLARRRSSPHPSMHSHDDNPFCDDDENNSLQIQCPIETILPSCNRRPIAEMLSVCFLTFLALLVLVTVSISRGVSNRPGPKRRDDDPCRCKYELELCRDITLPGKPLHSTYHQCWARQKNNFTRFRYTMHTQAWLRVIWFVRTYHCDL